MKIKLSIKGRPSAVLALAGSFFLYEWMRPYGWVPVSTGLPLAGAARLQTLLYEVETSAEPALVWRVVDRVPYCATYYLGELSPDMNAVSFYEFDCDDDNSFGLTSHRDACARLPMPLKSALQGLDSWPRPE